LMATISMFFSIFPIFCFPLIFFIDLLPPLPVDGWRCSWCCSAWLPW
jgi:hypothetical protein